MTRGRLLLLLALAAFLGWLGWLGYAVYAARYAPGRSVVLSRAQLTAATHLLVADVTVAEDGLPAPAVKVVEVLKGDGVAPGAEVEVRNLPSAKPPGAGGFPGPGRYLLPLVREGQTGPFRVAGMPRSPGYEPAPVDRPPIYRWIDDTRAQLRGLGVVP
ncbi:MAG TPA: hypothetical protein VFG68_17465 [Fimbriiglobus sp.]|nr:hypothetical protein [Fimbriiglobus sp.]